MAESKRAHVYSIIQTIKTSLNGPMKASADNSQKTESIAELCKEIEYGSLVLPEFQRDFVWEEGKTYELFDSLVRDIFIGSIIYGIPSFEITVRELDIRPRKGTGSRKRVKTQSFTKEDIESKVQVSGFRLVLDGQQRITSLYRALKGIDPVWFVMRPEGKLPDGKSVKDCSLEELLGEFTGYQSLHRLSIQLSDVRAIMDGNEMEDEWRARYFEPLKFLEGKSDEERKDLFRSYLLLQKKLQDLLKSEKLLSYYLLNTTSEKFSLFFERSNSKGIQLNFIDILAAKLYAGFNLRKHIESFEDEHKQWGALNREVIVRAIAYLVSEGKEIDRKYILDKLTAADFDKHWAGLIVSYVRCMEFLTKNHFILTPAWMPYPNMLIPLMLFLQKIGGDFSQMTESQSEFIKFWYWAAIFSEHYSGSSNERIIMDSRALSRIAENKAITDRRFFATLRCKITGPEDFLSLQKNTSALYAGILNLLNYDVGGLLDWTNTSKLTTSSRLEDHHVFPRGYLEDTYAEDSEEVATIDSVANRALIPKLTNIKIGKKSPATYLKSLKANNSNVATCLHNHALPTELIDGTWDNRYKDFLTNRAARMFALIEKHVLSHEEDIMKEFYQEPQAKSGDRMKVIARYRGKELLGELDLADEKIYIDGEVYSVSGAGIEAKKLLSGKDGMVTNGWQFWRYEDESGEERFIEDLRPSSGQIE
jgi:hypothetical protein